MVQNQIALIQFVTNSIFAKGLVTVGNQDLKTSYQYKSTPESRHPCFFP